jgi:mRNA interferase MazF
MADYRPGDIVLVDVPYTDLSRTKKRPALVLLPRGHDYLVAFLTSRVERAGPDDVFVAAGESNGLKADSVILVIKLFALHESIIIRRLGRLAEPDHRAVVDRLVQLLRSTLHP